MAISAKVRDALKQAMIDQETDRLATLRLINASITDKEIEMRGKGENVYLSYADILLILGRMAKQCSESARIYEEGGRLDLAERERLEKKCIEDFMPRQLTDTEVEAAIDSAIATVGAVSIRDMGRIMGMLKANHAGQMNFAQVGPKVKNRLCAT